MPVKISFVSIKLIMILIFFSLISITLHPENKLKFEIGLTNLPNQIEGNMIRDLDGFLWFCYYGGIARYDGYEIRYFRTEENSISGPATQSIVMDLDGDLWILTKENGLNKLDKRTLKFTQYMHDPEDLNSLSSNYSGVSSPQRLFADNRNRILIGTVNGLDIYDKNSGRFTHFFHDRENSNSLSDNNVTSVIMDSKGIIWIGTAASGLNRFDEELNQWTHFSSIKGDKSSLASNSILSLCEDGDGNIWIGTEDNGISVLSVSDNSFNHYQFNPEEENSLGDNKIYYLYKDSSDRIWVTHKDSGISGLDMFDEENNQFIRYSADPDSPYAISSNFVSTVYEDYESGIFWIVHTLDGVFDKYDKFSRNIGSHKHQPSNPNSLSNSQVLVITEDSANKIWISVEGALNVYDRKTNKYTHYVYSEIDPFLGPFTTALCWEDKEKIWLLSNRGLLTLFNTETGKTVQHFRNDPENPNSINRSTSTGGSVIKDEAESNILWLALSSGLDRFDTRTGLFTHYVNDPNDENTITAGSVWSVVDDGKGYLWISTSEGLCILSKKSEEITRFVHNPDDGDSIGFNQVSTVFIDSNEDIWVGGFTNGMDLFDRKKKVFRHYNIDTGFPVVGINQTIQEDSTGNLWIGTIDNGLVKFNLKSRSVIDVYSKSDGFLDNNFRRSFKSSDGEMWFSGEFGVNNFYPDQLNKNTTVPPVFLTEFTMGNSQDNVNVSPDKLKDVTLSWKQNFFEFQFAVLNYTHPEKNRFAYMLVGRDNDWFYSENAPAGRYSGLEGGNYTLRIKGSNNDGVWNDAGYSLNIKVIPPFWKSNWFFSAIVIGALAIIVLIFLYMKKLQFEIQERKHMETAFRDSEEKYRILVENVPDLRYRTNQNGKIVYISPSCFQMSGYTVEEALSAEASDELFFTIEERAEFINKLECDGIVTEYESELKRKNGSPWWASTNAHFYKDKDGNNLGVEGVTRDITARKKVEQELNKFRNYLSNIIDSMPSILVGVNAEGAVTLWNKTAEVTTGITSNEAQDKSLSEVFPAMADEMDLIEESIRTKETKTKQKKNRKEGNRNIFEDITIYPLITNGVMGAVVRVDNVTDRVHLEEVIVQSEKMLSIGGLAAGMAHEINNPLAGMLQTANVMARRLDDKKKIEANMESAKTAGTTMEAIHKYIELRGIPSMLEKINESGKRIAVIVNNMLTFARKSENLFTSNDISKILDKTLELAETDYDLKKKYDFKQITISREYTDDLPSIPCESAKLQQVLLNILRNGAQAMQSAGIENPKIIIRSYLNNEEKLLVIEIEDNGPGMSNEIKKKIFEPFFTTKPVGIGTGLGLSVSYFIITEIHKGKLSVESSEGYGCKFIIKLPI